MSEANCNNRLVRCCFNCADWRGVRRSDRGYCQRWNLSGKDATKGNDTCEAWNKRENARLPSSNTEIAHSEQTTND